MGLEEYFCRPLFVRIFRIWPYPRQNPMQWPRALSRQASPWKHRPSSSTPCVVSIRLSRIGQHIKDEPCAKQRALLSVFSSRYSSVSRGVRSVAPIFIFIGSLFSVYIWMLVQKSTTIYIWPYNHVCCTAVALLNLVHLALLYVQILLSISEDLIKLVMLLNLVQIEIFTKNSKFSKLVFLEPKLSTKLSAPLVFRQYQQLGTYSSAKTIINHRNTS